LEIVRTIADLRSHIASWRSTGARVGLVPTMGRCTTVIWHW